VVRQLLVFSRHSCGVLRCQMLNSFASYPSQFPFPLYFGWSSSLSSLRWPDHYSPRPSVILHANYVFTPFKKCYSSPWKLFVLTPHFLWWLHILLLIVWMSLQLLSKNPFLYLGFFWACNSVSRFLKRNLKCFLSLYKIFVFVYLPKNVYSDADQLLPLLLFWLAKFCLTLLRCIFLSS